MPGDIPVLHVDSGAGSDLSRSRQLWAAPAAGSQAPEKSREYVCKIEQAIIDSLDMEYRWRAGRRAGRVCVNGAKIAALGFACREAPSTGWLFNITGESTPPFARINPCGYAGLQVVALADLGGPSTRVGFGLVGAVGQALS